MEARNSEEPLFASSADTRVSFTPDLLRAVKLRALTLDELARSARVSPATVSAAVRGKRVNVSTALRISRAVSARPPIPELESWT
jgi:predicted transcriptional regulator